MPFSFATTFFFAATFSLPQVKEFRSLELGWTLHTEIQGLTHTQGVLLQ